MPRYLNAAQKAVICMVRPSLASWSHIGDDILLTSVKHAHSACMLYRSVCDQDPSGCVRAISEPPAHRDFTRRTQGRRADASRPRFRIAHVWPPTLPRTGHAQVTTSYLKRGKQLSPVVAGHCPNRLSLLALHPGSLVGSPTLQNSHAQSRLHLGSNACSVLVFACCAEI